MATNSAKLAASVAFLLLSYIIWFAVINYVSRPRGGAAQTSLLRSDAAKAKPKAAGEQIRSKDERAKRREKRGKNNKRKPSRNGDTGGGSVNPDQKPGSSGGDSSGNRSRRSRSESSSIGSNNPQKGLVDEHFEWTTNGDRSGLKLTVLNNLRARSSWLPPLKASLGDWNHGEAVSLELLEMNYDPECEQVPWPIKMCSEEYGETGWKGANQIYRKDGKIVASTCKLNDHYLKGMSRVEKQYIVCHEIGHGLGLKHSDEDFYNKDLGNCMDYSRKYWNNVHPGTSNFNALEALYGNMKGGRRLAAQDLDPLVEGSLSDDEVRSFSRGIEEPSTYSFNPNMVAYQIGGGDSQHPGSKEEWRLLHKTDTVETHETLLGNGNSVLTSILLA